MLRTQNGIDAVGYAAMHQRTEVLQAMVRLGVNVDKAVGVSRVGVELC